MTDLDEEFSTYLTDVQDGVVNYSEDEQNVINTWVDKLTQPKDTDEEKIIRNDYCRALAEIVAKGKQLSPPFSDPPPDEDLPPYEDQGNKVTSNKATYRIRKMPCAGSGQKTGAIPKTKKKSENLSPRFDDSSNRNEFEDPSEMARVIAKSKGQSFADFVISIARYTSDYGQELRTAMNTEVSSFKEYVDRVLSQRIKDLTEVLDEEQNRELLRIKKDIERWQLELSHVKRRMKEIFPNFDVDLYIKDPNYLRRVLTFSRKPVTSPNEKFERWKEESCHRLKWISDMTYKSKQCNADIKQELLNIKSNIMETEAAETAKQQCMMKKINCEMNEYHKLKAERDRLNNEISDLQAQLKAFEC